MQQIEQSLNSKKSGGKMESYDEKISEFLNLFKREIELEIEKEKSNEDEGLATEHLEEIA